MGGSKYGWDHQQERERWRPIVAAGEAYCAEPVCLMRSRWIQPALANTQLWHVCHDPSGQIVIGVGHRRCNLAEAARRGNRMRRRRPKKPEPPSQWWRP
jgi:hypothetical protein